MANDTNNFKVSEFACKCCRQNLIDHRILDMAQVIRDELGVPVRVNSGYRCDEHNRRGGGVKGSKHTKSLAADLSCKLGTGTMFEAVKKLHGQGKLPQLDYCIKYKTFIHIDCGGENVNPCGSYDHD